MESGASDATTRHAIGRRLKAGDTLAGRFVIVRFVANGGMGEVYEASDLQLQGKHHALKTLRPEFASNPLFLQRFEREVILAREVRHPNVCPTFDLFHVNDSAGPLSFLTMELLRGESLLERLARLGSINIAAALPIARQLAEGLDAAHGRGVIHRDFKPGNVMLEGEGTAVRVSITDFGLSRAMDSDMTLAETGQILGTPGYIAPEVIQGRVASYSADVYAFGVVLYEMLTGRKPVDEPGKRAHVPPSRLVPDLPEIWDRIVLGCLEPQPERRFKSAGEAIALLEKAGRTNSDLSIVERTKEPIPKWVAAGVLIAVMALAGVVGWPRLYSLLHPLPERRFVALMMWPAAPDPSDLPLLKNALETIGSRLARAEGSTKDLVIIAPGDVAAAASLKAPVDAVRALGANLVLAASVHSVPDGMQLDLAVLDAASASELRKRAIRVESSQMSRIPALAAAAAADLLDVRVVNQNWKDQDELSSVSPASFQLFNSAEDLAGQPNDAGLDAAIEKYQKLLENNPKFALAYARLSNAFARKYQRLREPAFLNVAEKNADLALKFNSDSVTAILSRANTDLYRGAVEKSLAGLQRALDLDPGNPQVLLVKARAFRTLDRAKDEQEVYREIIRNRPNFWPAYNQLGASLYRGAEYAKAAEAFENGLAVTPRIVAMLNNLGAAQMAVRKRNEAAATFNRSVAVTPTAPAHLNLGTLAYFAKDYLEAKDNYLKASALDPRNDQVWRNLGDVFTVLHEPVRVLENYAKAAEVVTQSLKINPQEGEVWMRLAFYQAKLGRRREAEAALRTAEQRGASTVRSQFLKTQAVMVLGQKEEALRLLLDCLKRGFSEEDIDLAIDLEELRKDARYLRARKPTDE